MSRPDRITLAWLVFFILMGATAELYYVVCNGILHDMPSRHDWLARGYAAFAHCDRRYYADFSGYVWTCEALNVFVTQPLHALLIYAILKQRPYRFSLQLGVSSYLLYSLVLYFTEATVSGYSNIPSITPFAVAVFYAVNLPWIAGNLFMALQAARSINQRFQA